VYVPVVVLLAEAHRGGRHVASGNTAIVQMNRGRYQRYMSIIDKYKFFFGVGLPNAEFFEAEFSNALLVSGPISISHCPTLDLSLLPKEMGSTHPVRARETSTPSLAFRAPFFGTSASL